MKKNRLDPFVKFAYGFGSAASGILGNAFGIFVLFYYQRIVGVDALLCGLVIFVALFFDALLRPMIGILSDGFSSSLGRRHPFIYLSVVPLSLSYWALFHPPQSGSQLVVFLWFLCCALLVRGFTALFQLPYSSLAAELTDDYDERTVLSNLASVFAWAFGPLNYLLAFAVFLPDTKDYPQGNLNPAGYSGLAVFGSVVIVVSILTSALATQKIALAVKAAAWQTKKIAFTQLASNIRHALGNYSYRMMTSATFALYFGFSISEYTSNYLSTYFWELFSKQQRLFFIPVICATFLALLITGRLSRRIGKKQIAIFGLILWVATSPQIVYLRLLGLLPENGDPLLIYLLLIASFFRCLGAMWAGSMIGALLADVTDEFELETGYRQEGLLYAGVAFCGTLASGVGALTVSAMIHLTGMSRNGLSGSITEAVASRFALLNTGAITVLVGLTILYFYRNPLSRKTHQETLERLVKIRDTKRLQWEPQTAQENASTLANS